MDEHLTDRFERAAIAALAACGLAMLLQAAFDGRGTGHPVPMLHRDLMMALLGLGLLMAPFIPALRVPAVVAAGLAKASLVGLMLHGLPADGGAAFGVELALLALLGFAGLVLLRQAQREARWNGVPVRRRG